MQFRDTSPRQHARECPWEPETSGIATSKPEQASKGAKTRNIHDLWCMHTRPREVKVGWGCPREACNMCMRVWLICMVCVYYAIMHIGYTEYTGNALYMQGKNKDATHTRIMHTCVCMYIMYIQCICTCVYNVYVCICLSACIMHVYVCVCMYEYVYV